MRKLLLICLTVLFIVTLSGCTKETDLPNIGDEYINCTLLDPKFGAKTVYCTDDLGVEVVMFYTTYKEKYDAKE